jgi:hypothetical protein
VRAYELATGLVLIAIAVVAMIDTRASALIDTSGRSPGGIGPGFYPFWAAAVMAGAGLVVVYRAARSLQAWAPVFENRAAVIAVAKLVGPMVLATAALVWLGFYFVCGLYMAYFARYIGRYRWLIVGLIAVVGPTVIYLAFELGFRVRLPKSGLYEFGFLI